jgi:hypothetical protein
MQAAAAATNKQFKHHPYRSSRRVQRRKQFDIVDDFADVHYSRMHGPNFRWEGDLIKLLAS